MVKPHPGVARLILPPMESNPPSLPDRNEVIQEWLTNVNEYSEELKNVLVNPSIPEPETEPEDAAKPPSVSRLRRESTFADTEIGLSLKKNVEPKAAPLHSKIAIKRTTTSTEVRIPLPDVVATIRAYKRACRKLKVLPLRRVIAQFGRTKIVFNNLCLSSADVRAICKALLVQFGLLLCAVRGSSPLSTVRRMIADQNRKALLNFSSISQYDEEGVLLDFSGNAMGLVEGQFVLRMLMTNRIFTELRLADNRLSGPALVPISRFFEKYKFIRVLDLSGNKLTDNDGKLVAIIIQNSPQMRVLHVHHNEFREIAGKAIGKAIENCGLEELDLSWNHLRQQGAIGIARGIEKNTSIEHANLAWNGFGFEGCVALSDALCRNTSLEKLDISSNRIHPPALLELMKGIMNNKVLKVLIMDRNPITPSFATVLLEAIQRAKTMALEVLSLQGVVVDRDFNGVLESIQEERTFDVIYEMSLPVSSRNRNDMVREVEMRNNYNVEPLRMLYLLKEKNRAQDFFHRINKDHNDCLTPDELHVLFKESGIPVSKIVIDKIMDFMDTDHNGEIDLGEFLVGDKKIKKISRDHARNSLQIGEAAQYSKYSRTFRKAHIQQLTSRLTVEDSQQYLTPRLSIDESQLYVSSTPSLSPSPASSRRSSSQFKFEY